MSLVQNYDVQGASIDTSRSLNGLTVNQSMTMGQFSFPTNAPTAFPTLDALRNMTFNGSGGFSLARNDTGVFGGVVSGLSQDQLAATLTGALGEINIAGNGGITPGQLLFGGRSNGQITNGVNFQNQPGAMSLYTADLSKRPTAIHGRWRNNPVGGGGKIEKMLQFNSSSHNRTVNRLNSKGFGSFTESILETQDPVPNRRIGPGFGNPLVPVGSEFPPWAFPGGIISLEVISGGTLYGAFAGPIALITETGSGTGAFISANDGSVAGTIFDAGTGTYINVTTDQGFPGVSYQEGDVVTVAGGDGEFRARVTKVIPSYPAGQVGQKEAASLAYATIYGDAGSMAYNPVSEQNDQGTVGRQGDYGSNSRNAMTVQNLLLANSSSWSNNPVFSDVLLSNGPISLPNAGVNTPFIAPGVFPGPTQYPLRNTAGPFGLGWATATPYGSQRRTRLAFADPKGINISGSSLTQLNVQQANPGTSTKNEVDADFVNSGNSGIGSRG